MGYDLEKNMKLIERTFLINVGDKTPDISFWLACLRIRYEIKTWAMRTSMVLFIIVSVMNKYQLSGMSDVYGMAVLCFSLMGVSGFLYLLFSLNPEAIKTALEWKKKEAQAGKEMKIAILSALNVYYKRGNTEIKGIKRISSRGLSDTYFELDSDLLNKELKNDDIWKLDIKFSSKVFERIRNQVCVIRRNRIE